MQAPAPKRAVRAAFDKAADSYDAVASVQRAACDRLLALATRSVHQPGHQPARILDAGCGTGYALAGLRQRFPAAELIALDFAPAMLRRHPPGLGPPAGRLRTAPQRQGPARLLRHLLADRRETPMTAFFIAGTDTEIGKTFVTCALLHAARAQGRVAVGMKPIAAGADMVAGELINEDAARLRAAGSFDPGLALLNPYCLKSPIAPHIAAAEEGVAIDPAPILAAFAKLQAQAELVLVEGVGGFRVPLGKGYDTADLARDLALPVILVVGMRLGCINHALLTAEAIQARGLQLAGWVANQVDPAMLRFEQNLEALTERLPAPLLGVTPFQADGDAAGAAAGLRLSE